MMVSISTSINHILEHYAFTLITNKNWQWEFIQRNQIGILLTTYLPPSKSRAWEVHTNKYSNQIKTYSLRTNTRQMLNNITRELHCFIQWKKVINSGTTVAQIDQERIANVVLKTIGKQHFLCHGVQHCCYFVSLDMGL